MEYKGYKLLDKILLVCRDKPEREDSHGWYNNRNYYQAYLVDPSNKKQISSARYWATWTEYGPGYKDTYGRWKRDYEIEHSPVEFEFNNDDFTLELLDCAGGSSQGGKLSFWNCLIRKNDNTFMIGINSDLLLDLLKNATFINGKCQSPLVFITCKGKVGMTVKGSATYNQCLKDLELKANVKSKAVSKFSFGDKISTATINEVYLGTINQYYTVTSTYTYYSYARPKITTVTKLSKPITHYLIAPDYYYGKSGEQKPGKYNKLSEVIDNYCRQDNAYCRGLPELRKTCPKRVIDGKLELDCTEDEFKNKLFEYIYDYKSFLKNRLNKTNFTEVDNLNYFLNSTGFGFGFQPFDLDPNLLDVMKANGITYVDETKLS